MRVSHLQYYSRVNISLLHSYHVTENLEFNYEITVRTQMEVCDVCCDSSPDFLCYDCSSEGKPLCNNCSKLLHRNPKRTGHSLVITCCV